MRLIILFILLIVSACTTNHSNLQTVASVDLNRYLGLWYQYAYFPNSFQPSDCALTTAEYSLRPNGKITVVNTCYNDWQGTSIKKRARAKAWAVDPSNAKLKVSFFFPFSGNYWIIDLDEENYSFAVVSEPSRKYLWILTRSLELDPATYSEILSNLEAKGFDLSKLIPTH